MEALATLEKAYELLDEHLTGGGWATGAFHGGRLRRGAGALLRAHRAALGPAALTRYFTALTARPSVARVIDEARQYRHLFPLPRPDYAQ